MKYAPLILLLFASCQMRITNRPFHSAPPSAIPADTVIILKNTDESPLPDSAFLVSSLRCKFTAQNVRPGYDSLVRFAGATARKRGGNVIKVRKAALRFTCLILESDVYCLPLTALQRYKTQVDSTDNAHNASLANRAVIHILDRDEMGRRSIFFNDSLMGEIKGVGFDGVRKPGKKTLELNRVASLKIIPVGVQDLDVKELPIQPGKEYFIVLYNYIGRHQIGYRILITDREHFENRDILFFF